MNTYAQINPDAICIGVSQLADAVSSPLMIAVPSYDVSLVGQHWTGSEWVEVAPPEPAPVRTLTKLAYINRFTDEELVGIYSAAKVSVPVEIWLKKFELAEEINLDDERTVSGLSSMEAAGLLGPGRAAEILA